jgi:hypothetical protein
MIWEMFIVGHFKPEVFIKTHFHSEKQVFEKKEAVSIFFCSYLVSYVSSKLLDSFDI